MTTWFMTLKTHVTWHLQLKENWLFTVEWFEKRMMLLFQDQYCKIFSICCLSTCFRHKCYFISHCWKRLDGKNQPPISVVWTGLWKSITVKISQRCQNKCSSETSRAFWLEKFLFENKISSLWWNRIVVKWENCYGSVEKITRKDWNIRGAGHVAFSPNISKNLNY